MDEANMSCHCLTDTPDFAYWRAVALPARGLAGSLSKVFGKTKREVRLRQLVDSYIGLVARVLRNAGTMEADVEDDVQRVFITLSNRLDDVRVGAEKSFLIQTALNMAAHSRRGAARRREILTDHPPEGIDPMAGPEELAHRRQLRRTLDRLLSEMDTDLRAVFTLFEFEEMTTAEIGCVLGIPDGTVASRLRRARVDFRERVATMESFSKTEVG
jgi:RNA polymerase sigma-70 factor, ECF subfamily